MTDDNVFTLLVRTSCHRMKSSGSGIAPPFLGLLCQFVESSSFDFLFGYWYILVVLGVVGVGALLWPLCDCWT